MAAESKIVAPDGSILAHVLTCDYRFYLIDSSAFRMIDEIEAYCRTCTSYVPSERIRTIADLTNELEWLNSLSGEDRDKAEFIHGTVESITDRFNTEQGFFRDRHAPPRCLECGSTDIIQASPGFGIAPTRLFHPEYLPNGLTVETFAFASTNSFYRLFNSEGEELILRTDELVDTVNRCEGRRVCCIKRNGKLYYGRSLEEA